MTSKEQPHKEGCGNASRDEDDARKRSQVNIMARDMFLNCLSISMLLQARPQLVLDTMKGDAARSSITLSRWTSWAAVVEFLISPTLGGLSDAIGRKPFLFLSPALNAFLRLLIANRPELWLLGIEKVFTSAVVAAGSVAASATLADVASGTELAIAQAKVGISAGAAFVFGPACAGILIKRKGARAAFVVSSCISVLQLGLLRKFQETVELDKRELTSVFVSPFSFLKIFKTQSRRLRALTVVGVLQAFCEPKTWNDMVQLYMRVNVGLPVERVGRFFATFGLAAIAAKGLTRQLIQKYGPSRHISLANIAGAIAFFFWGANPSSTWTSVVAPLALAPFSLDHKAGIITQSNDLATTLGFGKGEHAAMSQNLRALVVSAAPILFGRVYSWGAQEHIGRPGLGFWFAGTFALLAETVHQLSLSASDIE